MNTISVVMATYNGAKFIGRQMDSLFSQARMPIEIVICDDNSTDSTVEIVVNKARETLIPVRLYRNVTRLGYEDNFLKAASLAAGDLVAFCDQDDIWRSDKLGIVGEQFRRSEVSLCVHTGLLIDENDKEVGEFNQGITRSRIALPLSFSPWFSYFGFSMTFRRTLLEVTPSDHRGLDFISGNERMAHDRWVMFLANITGETVELAVPLVWYRQHGANAFGALGLPKPEVSADNLYTNFSKYIRVG